MRSKKIVWQQRQQIIMYTAKNKNNRKLKEKRAPVKATLQSKKQKGKVIFVFQQSFNLNKSRLGIGKQTIFWQKRQQKILLIQRKNQRKKGTSKRLYKIKHKGNIFFVFQQSKAEQKQVCEKQKNCLVKETTNNTVHSDKQKPEKSKKKGHQ